MSDWLRDAPDEVRQHVPIGRSLRRRALTGALWSIAGSGAGQLIRLVGNIVLSRLLFPEAFGLMALVAVVLQGLQMLSDVGITPAIVQSEHGDDPVFLNTSWTIQVFRGVLLAGCAVALAWPLAWVFSQNDPLALQLAALVPVAGIAALLDGFRSTRIITLQREIRLRRLYLLSFLAQIFGLSVAIGFALVTRSVWALVIGNLSTSAVALCLSHLWIPGIKNRFVLDKEASRALMTFGKWIFVSTGITFLALQADRILLGTLIPIEVLGVYSLALGLATLPREIMSHLTRIVVFPVLSEQTRTDPGSLAGALGRLRSVLLPLAMLLVLSVIFIGPFFFAFLYDERYHAAGYLTQLISLSIWLMCLRFTAENVVLSQGRTRALALSNAISLIITGVGSLVGYRLLDLTGFILGYALGPLAGLLVLHRELRRLQLLLLLDDVRYTALLLLLALMGTASPGLLELVGLHGPSIPLVRVLLPLVLLPGVGVWTARCALRVFGAREP